jgi:putative CocE/NonD family hydrolase
MAAEKPPHLTCIAPYDGHIDIYNGWAYPGGIPSEFMSLWWNGNVRPINRSPFAGPPRQIPYDVPYEIGLHPTFDAWWAERVVAPLLPSVEIPVFSIGVWAKLDLHLGGNILGWRAVRGPKWLMVTGAPNAFEACAEFEAVPFHRDVLAPFYDRFLKGLDNGFELQAPVQVFVRGAQCLENHAAWPPQGAREAAFHLRAGAAGHVKSLNDGRLDVAPPTETGETAYDYPRPDWAIGVAKLDVAGPDPLAEILTFTTPPLDAPLSIRGPCEFVAYLSSTRSDADLIVRLTHVPPPGTGQRPAIVTKGWLRASHRALDAEKSTEMEPYHSHADPQPIEPGKIYRFEISIEPMAHRFKKDNRVRLEIVNGDSVITDVLWTHYYVPSKIGADTIYHSAEHPSALTLPVTEGAEGGGPSSR